MREKLFRGCFKMFLQEKACQVVILPVLSLLYINVLMMTATHVLLKQDREGTSRPVPLLICKRNECTPNSLVFPLNLFSARSSNMNSETVFRAAELLFLPITCTALRHRPKQLHYIAHVLILQYSDKQKAVFFISTELI